MLLTDPTVLHASPRSRGLADSLPARVGAYRRRAATCVMMLAAAGACDDAPTPVPDPVPVYRIAGKWALRDSLTAIDPRIGAIRQVVLGLEPRLAPTCAGHLVGRVADGRAVTGAALDLAVDSTVRPPLVRFRLSGELGGGRTDPRYAGSFVGRFSADGTRLEGRFDDQGTIRPDTAILLPSQVQDPALDPPRC